MWELLHGIMEYWNTGMMEYWNNGILDVNRGIWLLINDKCRTGKTAGNDKSS
jgi:hypothetical protein